MKTYKFPFYGQTYEVSLQPLRYTNNDTPALQLVSTDEYGNEEPFGVATINLPESIFLEKNTQFVDENNLPGIGKWLQDNGLAEPTEIIVPSGFCRYQAYKFKGLEFVRG